MTQFFHKMQYDLKDHPSSYKTTFSPFVDGPILIKICMKANIMKTQFFHKLYNVTFILLRSLVISYFKTF